MHYKDYTTEDFIQDELFQQWVRSPNAERDQYWNTFLHHHPHQREKINEARQFLLRMDFNRPVSDAFLENIRLNIHQAIDIVETPQLQLPVQPLATRRASFKAYYAVAASLVAAIAFTGYLLVTKQEKPGPLAFLSGWQEQHALKGEKLHITLSDGSHVWLNGNSAIRYHSGFATQANREVYLEGEAFFDVAENKQKPFIVHASNLSIRVLGTAFNVRSYDDEEPVETTLVRGKVTLESNDKTAPEPVTLLPNQRALYSRESNTINLQDVNAENYTAWKSGWIVFDDKPFSYIEETLERWYNVSITLEDEHFRTCTFSGKFHDKSLEEVLEIFKSTSSIQYHVDGDEVTITGGFCEDAQSANNTDTWIQNQPHATPMKS